MKLKIGDLKIKNYSLKLFLGIILFVSIFGFKTQIINAQDFSQEEELIGQLQDANVDYTYLGNGAISWEGDFVPPLTGVGAIVSDVGNTLQYFLKAVKDFFVTNWKERAKSLANIAYKNLLRNFTSQLAYDTATRLVEGGWDKSPLFSTDNFGNYLVGVRDQTLMDTLDVVASTNGFLQFDVCEPGGIDLKFALHSALFDNFQEGKIRTKARCSWQQISANWNDWFETTGKNLTSEEYLKTLQNAFTPDNSEVGMYLTISSKLSQQIADKKTAAAFDRLSKQNFKDITAPISGLIKTPATMNKTAADELAKTSVLSAPELVSTGDIVADSIGIFTNTLAAKAIKQWFEKGLTSVVGTRGTLVYNWAIKAYTAKESLASLTAIHLAEGGEERLLEPLAQCGDTTNPGSTDCVITSTLAGAIEQKMTVQEAVDKNFLKGDGYFGFKVGGYEKITDYKTALPYRSLVILRQHRVIPVAWESAALYWYSGGDPEKRFPQEQLTLNYLLKCFEDPKDPESNAKPESCIDSALGFNPYYHLVDPNWVLKIPESFCVKKGSGNQILSAVKACLENNVAGTKLRGDNVSKAEILTPACDPKIYDNPDREVYKFLRNDQYCADYQTCLTEDAEGKCISTETTNNKNKGYCLKEEPLWRLPSKTCEAQFDTCESFKRTSDGQDFSYLRNTLQECSSQDGGCWWYSTLQKDPRRVPVTDSEGKQLYEPLIGPDGKQVIKAGQPAYSSNPVYEWVSDWSDQDRVYLNNRMKTCGSTDAGCTKLSRMLPGTNLVFNGDFSQTETVDDKNKPLGWDKKECVDVSDGALILLDGCSVTTSGNIPVDYNFSYLLSADLSGDGYIQLNGKTYPNAGASLEQLLTGIDVTFDAKIKQVTINIVADKGGRLTADNIQLLINKSPIAWHNDKYGVAKSTYRVDYSQNETGRQYFKVAPSYLKCVGYNQILNSYQSFEEKRCQTDGHFWRTDLDRCVWSGAKECVNFATLCKAEEVGCQLFRSVNDEVEITGAPRAADYCPSKCVGYDSYLEMPTRFTGYANPNAVGKMVNFIPAAARSCSAIESGCEEFTNLDATTSGGEQLEYFTDFRQCISKDNTNITTYYTWEGSDVSGYQLQKWEFLQTNFNEGLNSGAPCVNLVLGSSSCQDSNDNIQDQKTCSPEIFKAGTNPACLEFFNVAGKKFYILQDKPIIASTGCRAYRRTADNNIYNVDLTLSKRCSASSNGCREYKGNQSNNQKIIFNDTFEDGTIGNWSRVNKSDYNALTTLEYSTEALNQGGHSLKLIGWPGTNYLYRDIQLTPKQTKEYKLSFWAKKIKIPVTGGNGQGTFGTESGSVNTNINSGNNTTGGNQSSFNLIPRVQAQTTTDMLPLDFDTSKLNSEWQLFTTNKMPFPANDTGVVTLQLTLANANPDELYYFDNFTLTASANILYAIKDSWNTPDECNQPFSGAQLGCKQYKDLGSNYYYLKSLNSLCSASAVGCEAYINTQNSTLAQGKQEIKDGKCNVANGGVIKQDAKGLDQCYINNRLMCAGSDCKYMEPWIVPNDELIYLVNDPGKLCSADKQGCSQLGKPEFDRSLENYSEKNSGLDKTDFVKSYENLYLINNPDTYNTTACSENGLFCVGFNGDLSGSKYYYDPQGFRDESGKEFSRTCYFKDGKWFKTGSSPEVECNSIAANFYLPTSLPTSDNNKYSGQVGICPAEQSTCTGFRQPQAKSITGVEKCDANISPRLTGVCVSGVDDKDTKDGYCEKEINGVRYKVCKLNSASQCNYSASGWFCAGAKECTVAVADKTSYTGTKPLFVCEIKAEKADCQYSLVCPADYYLKKDLEPRQDACKSGKINPEGGCALLFDSSLAVNSTEFAADNTGKLQEPSSCDKTVGFGNNKYCNANQYYGITRDRQCAEWLSCGSAMVSDTSEETCQELIKCDRSGSCQKTGVDDEKTTLNITSSDYKEALRYLSGFSKPIVTWKGNGTTKAISGRSSPEALLQIGSNLALQNGGFEIQEGAIDQPANWTRGLVINHNLDNNGVNNQEGVITRGLEEYADGQCRAFLDETVYHNGRYSLMLTAVADLKDRVCYYQSNSGRDTDSNGQAFFEISKNNTYVVSFYARSSSEQQKFRVGLVLYDAKKKLCDDKNAQTYCNGKLGDGTNGSGIQTGPYGYITGNNNRPETPPSDRWQKYTYVFDLTKLPSNTTVNFAKALIEMNDTYNNNQWGAQRGSIWFDDFTVASVLAVGGKDPYLRKECRLFPDSSAPDCYYADTTIHRGWNGYCLDPDPFYQKDLLNPNDYSKCLQWYPMDVLQGDEADVFSKQSDLNNYQTVYTGPRPLYYCLQSENFGTTTSKVFYDKKDFINNNDLGANPPNGQVDYTCYINKFVSDSGESIPTNQLNINSISWLRVQNTMASGGEKYPEPIVDFADIKTRQCGDKWVAMQDSSGNPTDMFRIDCSQANPGVKTLIFYPYGNENYDQNILSGDHGRNFLQLVIDFDEVTGRIVKEILINPSDGTGDTDESASFITFIYLKEICSSIAQVVDSEGRQKVKLSEYNSPASKIGDYKKILSDHPFSGVGGLLKDYGGFQQPADPYILPNNWSSSQVPLSVYFGGSGGGFAGLPLSKLKPITVTEAEKDRVCLAGAEDKLGTVCKTSVDCESDNQSPTNVKKPAGVCGGLGKLCYYNGNTYGKPCNVPDNCPALSSGGEKGNCKLPDTVLYGDSSWDSLSKAIVGLKTVFGKIFKIWNWQNNYYVIDNQVYSDSEGKKINLDAVPTGAPEIKDLTMNPNTIGVLGDKVNLIFGIKPVENQLPIRKIEITWGDGRQNVYEGTFDAQQKKFNHFYGCKPNSDGTCAECYIDGGKTKSAEGGRCKYDATVRIIDNWDAEDSTDDWSGTPKSVLSVIVGPSN